MPSGKEIRSKIESIKKTQKITKAMELVAASKMRKALERMEETRPYAKKALQVIKHIANCTLEYQHPYTMEREIKRAGFIIVSSDRGLCGGLNNTLFKTLVLRMHELQKQGVEVSVCLIGSKAAGFFKRHGFKVEAVATQLGDAPRVKDLVGVVKVMLDKYDNAEIDALYMGYNRFVNTMKQDAIIQQVLPLEHATDESAKYVWNYIYEPDPKELLDLLLTRYIESQVYQSVVENLACEQASRMVAMKSATDNAGNLIEELKLAYNKARQALITREIAEIVSGAEAV